MSINFASIVLFFMFYLKVAQHILNCQMFLYAHINICFEIHFIELVELNSNKLASFIFYFFS